jgi:hypothetical protein
VVIEPLQRLLSVWILGEGVAADERFRAEGQLVLTGHIVDRLRGFQAKGVCPVRVEGRLRVILVAEVLAIRPFSLRVDMSWQTALDQCGQRD